MRTGYLVHQIGSLPASLWASCVFVVGGPKYRTYFPRGHLEQTGSAGLLERARSQCPRGMDGTGAPDTGQILLLTDSFCPWSYQGTCHASTALQLVPQQSSVGYLKGRFEGHSVSWKRQQQAETQLREAEPLCCRLRGSSQAGNPAAHHRSSRYEAGKHKVPWALAMWGEQMSKKICSTSSPALIRVLPHLFAVLPPCSPALCSRASISSVSSLFLLCWGRGVHTAQALCHRANPCWFHLFQVTLHTGLEVPTNLGRPKLSGN